MNNFPDIMVDVESTGLSFDHSAVIQIAAVKFNLKERTIGEMFDRCLLIPGNRFWDEGARQFWMKKPEIFQSIQARMEPVKPVLDDFYAFARAESMDPIMWGKPTHFDHSILSSYYREYGPQMPFHYRQANDMNSFMRGMYHPASPPPFEIDLPFDGPAHNALFDCIHQIKVLFHAVDCKEGKGQYANIVEERA